MVVHSAEESFPYRGVTLAVHLVRLLSVLMGTVTVLATYCIARQIMPQRKGLAIGAAVINAFNPQFAFISGTINNDNLVIVLFALAALLLVVLGRREVSRGRLLLLGLVIGLASLTKLTGLMLLPLAAVVLGVVALHRQRLISFVVWMTIVSIVALVVGGWWYARNWLLYGDPLGMKIMSILFRTRVYRPSLLELLAEFKGLRMSFWALFGWFNILAEPWLYLAFDGLALLGAAGLLLLVFKQLRKTDLRPHSNMEETPSWPWLLFLLSWIAVVLAGLVRWTQMTRASQGRLMYPAISAISILLFTGLAQWVPWRAATSLAGVLGVIMLAIAVVSPFRYIAPAYARHVLSISEGVSLLSETDLL
jgi:4-amino-4-deoxy-L-arabinose transferase-like glycosyltransferase